jgi:hypothetical protein
MGLPSPLCHNSLPPKQLWILIAFALRRTLRLGRWVHPWLPRSPQPPPAGGGTGRPEQRSPRDGEKRSRSLPRGGRSEKSMKNRKCGKNPCKRQGNESSLEVWTSPVAGELPIRTWACPFREPVLGQVSRRSWRPAGRGRCSCRPTHVGLRRTRGPGPNTGSSRPGYISPSPRGVDTSIANRTPLAGPGMKGAGAALFNREGPAHAG